jgi:hypothetical protein
MTTAQVKQSLCRQLALKATAMRYESCLVDLVGMSDLFRNGS